MNNRKRRDEISYRLSSFLFKEGNLEVNSIVIIKDNVFKIMSKSGKKYILKCHSQRKVVDQQWQFFDTVENQAIIPFIRYPNGRKVIVENNYYWTISPFIKGNHLNYRFKVDRKHALNTLNDFHSKAERIYIDQPLNRSNVIIRWYRRLDSFRNTEDIFVKYGLKKLHKEIVQTAVKQFDRLSQFPWDEMNRIAKKRGTWVHGDVASHNFMKNKDNETFMIDFDLLECTSHIYDYIQLGQRFLPYINWDLEELLSYRMVREKELKLWLSALHIPSDLMRDMLYTMSAKPATMQNHLNQMEKQWDQRKLFLKQTHKMLK